MPSSGWRPALSRVPAQGAQARLGGQCWARGSGPEGERNMNNFVGTWKAWLCRKHHLQIENLKVVRHAGILLLSYPLRLSPQEETITHDQVDGTMSPAVRQTMDQQWCWKRCIRPGSRLPWPAVQLQGPDAQHTKVINTELVKGTLPRSENLTSRFSSLANWPYELREVRASTSLDLSLIIYKVRWLN